MKSPAPFFEIPYYHDFISPALAENLLKTAREVPGVAGLKCIGATGGLETAEGLKFLVELYSAVKGDLARVLEQRVEDRKFLDVRVAACDRFNRENSRRIVAADYATVLGLEDANGRVVMGPKRADYCKSGGKPIAAIPEFLQGPHVTLFGPPGSAKMAINAMNAYHRKIKDEPAVVEQLLKNSTSHPKWGADDEDSKTPLHADLVEAGENLSQCFEGTISDTLAKDHLSIPIKRFPGLALPSTFLFYQGDPIPLHLYDFALHVFRNFKNPMAMVFYVPKLENEEEAAYIHTMIRTAEDMIKRVHPQYVLGTIRLMIVLENPRAILRTHEIMDALHPYFVGASLGWHDYLASTARVFREDSHYRIPVKADPDIVIKYIQASHRLLADVVGSRGGIKVGGMYGILPLDNDRKSRSFQITMKGYIRDVITQLKRDLTGFWVAHPDFVRLGLALVEGWRVREKGDGKPLETLVRELLDPADHKEILDFINGPDVTGLDVDDPAYVRKLIVADIEESDFIANNDPEEIRYNVFQSLQYLTDWLAGNGCVALPAHVKGVAVRVMDDLATAERSRWEVWHELRHGRFSHEDFLRIVHEEMRFIRKDLSNEKKIVQVKWSETTAKWYPVALKIMLKLMTDREPVEFATELLMPFTVETIREAADPWQAVTAIDGNRFAIDQYVERYSRYFEICGAERFAREMAKAVVFNEDDVRALILSFSEVEILEAASFHGDIGESKKNLDRMAAGEQALVEDSAQAELRRAGAEYLHKFGFKFLISAQGKSGAEMLAILRTRLARTKNEEIEAARLALWEISLKRMRALKMSATLETLAKMRERFAVPAVSIAINSHGFTQSLKLGECTREDRFEIASLSKTFAAAFACEYFAEKKISLATGVNELLAKSGSKFRLQSDDVCLEHLMNHTALNMHYVNGFQMGKMPALEELLNGGGGYQPIAVANRPGTKFQYSGGGFLVLQHLIEAFERKAIDEVIRPFLKRMGLHSMRFEQNAECVEGQRDSGEKVRLAFPAFAAGAVGAAGDMAVFLRHLSDAFNSLAGAPGISHDSAVQMLRGQDRGSLDFMGAFAGMGVFVVEGGANRFAIHQGANDGFRALYVQCFAGPDRGKGFVLLNNADNQGMLFNAFAAQILIRELGFSGVDTEKFNAGFDFKNLPQEQVVNLGYKKLIFDAFQPDLPEAIVKRGPLDANAAINLATRAKIVAVSDQKFARGENLISPHEPVFDPALFGRQGKIMDSWETRRHNEEPFDFLRLELAEPSEIAFVTFSTKFHDGNHPQFLRLKGRANAASEWTEIVPKIPFEGHALIELKSASSNTKFAQVEVELYPDGGLTRLGLFKSHPQAARFKAAAEAKCSRFSDPIPKTLKPLAIPFSSGARGSVIKVSNEHYGPAAAVLSPFPAIHMFDGLENARSRKPGNSEEVVIRLPKAARVQRVELDWEFFVNNNPMFVKIEGLCDGAWVELVAKSKVKAFAGNQRAFAIGEIRAMQDLRVTVYPDGGINRIRVY